MLTAAGDDRTADGQGDRGEADAAKRNGHH
jgi:hypothetical protein